MLRMAIDSQDLSRSEQSNVLQMTTGYFAYADNASKRMVEILHRMGLLVTYETVRRALNGNALAVSNELKDKAWNRGFFFSLDNMNFYEHWLDERLHNKGVGVQVAYTGGYVCFMRSAHDEIEEANWEQRYLDASQLDYNAVNQLLVEDFEPIQIYKFNHLSTPLEYVL